MVAVNQVVSPDYLNSVYNIPITDIKCIEFVEQVLTIFMGWESLSPGGTLIITTKSETFWNKKTIRFNMKAWFPTGYRKAAEFYSPKYETEEDLKKGTDRRTTVFWKPNVFFKNGEAEFDFYTADSKNSYSVVI
jgi:hypothetical protein